MSKGKDDHKGRREGKDEHDRDDRNEHERKAKHDDRDDRDEKNDRGDKHRHDDKHDRDDGHDFKFAHDDKHDRGDWHDFFKFMHDFKFVHDFKFAHDGKHDRDDKHRHDDKFEHKTKHERDDKHDNGAEHHKVPDGIKVYEVDLKELNHSGVDAKAILLLDEAHHRLVVKVDAEGLEPNKPGGFHPMHLHGFEDDKGATKPPKGTDHDGDGYTEVGEGADFYGPVQLNLSLNPENATHDRSADGSHDHTSKNVFPSIGKDGKLDYFEVFKFDKEDPSAAFILDLLRPLEKKVMVIHGLSVPDGEGEGTDGEVNGEGGYKASLPVAVGEVHKVTDHDDIRDALKKIEKEFDDHFDRKFEDHGHKDHGYDDHGHYAGGHQHHDWHV